MNLTSSSKISSLVFNLLIAFSKLSSNPKTSKYWWKAWFQSNKILANTIVSTKIHGYPVFMNFGYSYPLNARMFTSLNAPLVELVYQCYISKEVPVTIIDVGAAIGDTILLLYSNCPSMINGFYCVDGDKEFFQYLQKNLEKFEEGKLLFSMLSHSETVEKDLIRTHKGTASAQGEGIVQARSLDSLMQEAGMQKVDVLKIDVDGFDGKVLLGARNILKNMRPAVIFEWHPILCSQTGNNWTDHFDVLIESGYQNFIYFDKYGKFTQFMTGCDRKSLDILAELCLRNKHDHDWHYDVIALHHSSLIKPALLAELSFAKVRRSKF